ncbi:FecR family protein [Chitinophaga sp.]|uniref:FecR family protein n=1 Tax=Chitinophaga sp. TaxID=1869181 RepID=UPI002F92621E
MRRIAELIHKHLHHDLAPAEEQELMQYVKSEEFDEVFKQQISEYWQTGEGERSLPADRQLAVLDKILFSEQTATQLLQTTTRHGNKRVKKGLAAATILLLLAGTSFFFLPKQAPKVPLVAINRQHTQEILPGKTGAILTLADGSTIVLDSAKQGALAKQSGTRIVKTATGALTYDVTDHPGTTAIAWNTITTPRGAQYEVVLPDGTRVWLNAASTLKYPVAFAKGTDRKVMLSGEAYFEVNSNAQAPFKVAVHTQHNNDGEVTVLGTRFNIMAYDDEAAVRTTLLEGAVLVSRSGNSKKLAPGQQAIFPLETTSSIVVENTDTEIAIAWKKGFFRFDQRQLPAIMRQVSRWYDVDIAYEGKVPDIVFGGGIDKNLPLSRILSALGKYGIRFETDGRKINVLASQSTESN